MERTDPFLISEDWKQKTQKLIIAKKNGIYFLRRGVLRRDDTIIGHLTVYCFSGAISAVYKTFNFLGADIMIGILDLSRGSLKSLFDDERAESVKVSFGGKAYDLVDGEGVNFTVEPCRLIIKIRNLDKTLRKFVVPIRRESEFLNHCRR